MLYAPEEFSAGEAEVLRRYMTNLDQATVRGHYRRAPCRALFNAAPDGRAAAISRDLALPRRRPPAGAARR